MINEYKINYNNFFYFIYFSFPFTLITGPAITDVFLTFFVILVLMFKSKLFFRLNEAWMLFFLTLWFWFIISSFNAYNFSKSIIDALIYLRFIFFILFSYLLMQYMSKKLIKIILYIIFTFCLLVSLDSMFQFYNYTIDNGFGTDLLGIEPLGLYGRLSGPFNDLVPGSYLSRFIFFIFLLYLIEIEKFEKNIYLNFFFNLVLALNLSVIYFSGERMALATTMLGLVICLIFVKKLRSIIITSISFAFIFIIINLLYHPHFNNYEIIKSLPNHEGLVIKREFPCDNNKICSKEFKTQPTLISVLKNFDKSAYGQIYLSALHMWTDHKYLGIGLSNFNQLCNEKEVYKKYNTDFGCTTHPHNIYIQILVETGLIGFLIFITLLFLIFKKIYEIKDIDKKYILITIFLTIFWPVMSTGSILKNWNMCFISFLISLILIITKTNNLNLKK